jgi:toxin ParE1/3/4
MIVVNKTARAEQDLLDIWLYTFRTWGEVQADRYLDELGQGIRLLVENPHLGSDYGHICDGYRRLSINYHRVFYRLFGDSLEIVRVLHESMDIDTHLDT